jgi:acetyl esterase/lipase
VIVSIEYRLAPEHKAPAQLDDMLKGFQWVSFSSKQILKRQLIGPTTGIRPRGTDKR